MDLGIESLVLGMELWSDWMNILMDRMDSTGGKEAAFAAHNESS